MQILKFSQDKTENLLSPDNIEMFPVFTVIGCLISDKLMFKAALFPLTSIVHEDGVQHSVSEKQSEIPHTFYHHNKML